MYVYFNTSSWLALSFSSSESSIVQILFLAVSLLAFMHSSSESTMAITFLLPYSFFWRFSLYSLVAKFSSLSSLSSQSLMCSS